MRCAKTDRHRQMDGRTLFRFREDAAGTRLRGLWTVRILRWLRHRRGHQDVDASASNAGLDDQRQADPAGTWRAVAPRGAVPLRRTESQGNYGNPAHRNVVPAA